MATLIAHAGSGFEHMGTLTHSSSRSGCSGSRLIMSSKLIHNPALFLYTTSTTPNTLLSTSHINTTTPVHQYTNTQRHFSTLSPPHPQLRRDVYAITRTTPVEAQHRRHSTRGSENGTMYMPAHAKGKPQVRQVYTTRHQDTTQHVDR